MPSRFFGVILAIVACSSAPVQAAQIILNEYNAVADDQYLNGGDEFMDEDGNVPPPSDPFFGRVLGNGGDWFELVVIADHLDARGWQLEILEDGMLEPRLVFTQDPIWSDLRAGTIITVAEDVPDDVSYDPIGGDWWINVRAADTKDGGTGLYITADNFPVSNDDWQLTIYDAQGVLVFGPAGEGIVGDDGVPSDVGVNNKEIFELEDHPSALIARDSPFYDDGKSSTFAQENVFADGEAVQDFSALRLGLPFPDRDGDGIPDDGDRSGIVGDAPCTGGAIADCDDNCPTQQNPEQTDIGGLAAAPPDGIGDACQCGDVNDSGTVTGIDAFLIRRFLMGLPPGLAAPEKCSVTGGTECDNDDFIGIVRALRGLGQLEQVCEAAAIPRDLTDFMFDPDRVIAFEITMDPAEWDELRMQTQTWDDRLADPNCGMQPWPSPFTWFSAEVTVDGQPFTDVGIRKKGFVGSLSMTKPALKLQFDRFRAGQRVNGVEDMTLNNAQTDSSFVRQCLSLMFFSQAGVAASRCNFAQVTVNGDNLGVFVNVETVKGGYLARNFADATGKLWEGEVSDFWPGSWSGTFEPETDAAEEDRTELDAVAQALQQLAGDALLAELETYVDIDQFITYWAAETVVSHLDGYHKTHNNYFVYIDPTIGRMQFFPWDTDQDFTPFNAPVIQAKAALARKLYNIEETRLQYLARVQELLDIAWTPDTYIDEIFRMEALLTPVLIEADMLDKLDAMLRVQELTRQWISGRESYVEDALAVAPDSVLDFQIVHPCDAAP